MRATPLCPHGVFSAGKARTCTSPFPEVGDVVSTLKVWAVLRHSIPWPCEAEILCLSWLLAASSLL